MKKSHFIAWVVCFLTGLSTSMGWSQGKSITGFGFQIRHFGYDIGIVNQKNPQTNRFIMPYKWTALWLGLMKDPREVRVLNERLPASRLFVIEKVSHTLCSRVQFGRIIPISDRRSQSEIGLQLNTSLQIPIAYSWPMYVWLYQPASFGDSYASVAYNPAVHDVNLVGGNASFTKDIGKGNIFPGLGFALSLQAEWGNYGNITNTLSVGVSCDQFAKKLPIWYRNEMNRDFFPAVFVTFVTEFKSNLKP